MKISIENNPYDISSEQIEGLKPHFSLFEGRRFILNGKALPLNVLIAAFRTAALNPETDKKEVKALLKAFTHLKNRGYEKSKGAIKKKNPLVQLITFIKHRLSMKERNRMLKEVKSLCSVPSTQLENPFLLLDKDSLLFLLKSLDSETFAAFFQTNKENKQFIDQHLAFKKLKNEVEYEALKIWKKNLKKELSSFNSLFQNTNPSFKARFYIGLTRLDELTNQLLRYYPYKIIKQFEKYVLVSFDIKKAFKACQSLKDEKTITDTIKKALRGLKSPSLEDEWALSILARYCAETGKKQGILFAEAIKDPDRKAGALAPLLGLMSQSDLKKALDIILSPHTYQMAKYVGLKAIFEACESLDSDKALDIISQVADASRVYLTYYPPGPNLHPGFNVKVKNLYLFSSLVRAYVKTDHMAEAKQVIKPLPDDLKFKLLRKMVEASPKIADQILPKLRKLVDRIDDKEKKYKALIKVAKLYAKIDLDQALLYFDEAHKLDENNEKNLCEIADAIVEFSPAKAKELIDPVNTLIFEKIQVLVKIASQQKTKEKISEALDEALSLVDQIPLLPIDPRIGYRDGKDIEAQSLIALHYIFLDRKKAKELLKKPLKQIKQFGLSRSVLANGHYYTERVIPNLFKALFLIDKKKAMHLFKQKDDYNKENLLFELSHFLNEKLMKGVNI